MSNTEHVIKDISSANLVSGYGVMLSRYYKEGSTYDGAPVASPFQINIGLISGMSFNESRPVMQQGEIGSKTLFTLINEGQKSLSFNRLLPIPTDNIWENTGGELFTPVGSILSVLYADELKAELNGAGPGVIMFDIEQYDCFRLPIDLALTIFSETKEMIANIWLQNASVSGASIAVGAGSQQSMEPTQISWERTVELDVGFSPVS